ncbi:MAG: acyl-CoA thioesterase [Phycisphaerae bacterium]|nr:acyl-CoA thioesterase [Phycisphaerae bacterium]
MSNSKVCTTIRVRYSEIDRMGTFYNSRALEWFEVGRTEWLRATGIAYSEMERRGVGLPLVESHVEYIGTATYDDELQIAVSAEMSGKARMRFDIEIARADGSGNVARGYTVHALIDPTSENSGTIRPIRPPQWFLEAIQNV